jgi:hypothetical protein
MKIEQKVRAAAKKNDCKISLTFRADSNGGYELELDGVIYVFHEADLIKFVEVVKEMKGNG